jgi:hypothetical protein
MADDLLNIRLFKGLLKTSQPSHRIGAAVGVVRASVVCATAARLPPGLQQCAALS